MELVLENVTKNFGGLRAVGDVSFTVRENVIFGLIGPNGAGKTTVFNLITGVYKHDEGRIAFGGRDLAPLKPAQIAGVGIGRTFQNIRLFGQLTVIENLLVACELQKKAHLASAVLRLPVHYEDEKAMEARAFELLRVFDLHEMADEAPTSLSYGNQRRLEIARAMMLKPKILLLDEPAAGMNYGEAEGLKTQIRWLRDTFELAVVLVEHNMQVVMGVCEDIHVLDHGETIAHGAPEEIRKHPKVLAAYLGEEEEEAPSVRAAVEEASRPDVSKLAAPSSRSDLGKLDASQSGPHAKIVTPAAAMAPVAVAPAPVPPAWPTPSRPDFGRVAVRDLTSDPPPAQKLSDDAMADISKGLVASLERGLSSADLAGEIALKEGDRVTMEGLGAKIPGPEATPPPKAETKVEGAEAPRPPSGAFTETEAPTVPKQADAAAAAARTKHEETTKVPDDLLASIRAEVAAAEASPANPLKAATRPAFQAVDAATIEAAKKMGAEKAAAAAAAQAAVPKPKDSERDVEALSNVDAGWGSSNKIVAAKPVPPDDEKGST